MSPAEMDPVPAVEQHAAVEELQTRITALQAQRQQLRGFGAEQAWLEQNRLELAHSQRELSHALIERHRPARFS
ncbi:MAG TPA: hypothetical protein VHQ98_01620 [Gaiellaceae bacterium]|jgi:O-glycosyl hydrolase|nr:hypothetical protein [Gaiellaceae bacterium]